MKVDVPTYDIDTRVCGREISDKMCSLDSIDTLERFKTECERVER